MNKLFFTHCYNVYLCTCIPVYLCNTHYNLETTYNACYGNYTKSFIEMYTGSFKKKSVSKKLKNFFNQNNIK